MKALLNLFNKYYWKSFFGPFFTFIFPLVMLGVFGSTSPDKNLILPGILSMVTVNVGMNSIPTVIIDFKTSVLMKRIGTTPIKRWHFTTTITAYFVVIALLALFWTILWSLVFFQKSAVDAYRNVNWGELLFAQLFSITLATGLGFLTATVSKTAAAAGAIGGIFGILSNFLSGQIIPIDQINAQPALKGLSYALPFRYTTGLTVVSFNGDLALARGTSIFDVTTAFETHPGRAVVGLGDLIVLTDNGSTAYEPGMTGNVQVKPGTQINIGFVEVYSKVDKVLNLVLPTGFILFSGYITVRFFKWGRR